MKLRAVAAILVVGALSVVVGCTGGDKAEKPAQTANAAASPAAQAAGSIGVPECDTYMTKYRECIESKVPDSAKATVRQSLDQATAAWKQAAATPEGRTGLAQACKQATDAARMAMQAYGCSFLGSGRQVRGERPRRAASPSSCPRLPHPRHPVRDALPRRPATR